MRRARRRQAALVALTLAAAARSVASVAPIESAKPRVESARMRAVVDLAAGAARVQIEYDLSFSGLGRVPVRALALGGATPARFRAGLGARGGSPAQALPVPNPGAPSDLFEVEIGLPAAARSDGAPPLQLAYEVDGGVVPSASGWEVSLPVAAVLWPTPRDAREAFTAEVTVVGGGEIYRSFPARFAPVEPPEPGTSRYTTALPAVPATLRLSIARGDRPSLTAERLAEGLLVAVLVGFGGVAGLRFRRALA